MCGVGLKKNNILRRIKAVLKVIDNWFCNNLQKSYLNKKYIVNYKEAMQFAKELWYYKDFSRYYFSSYDIWYLKEHSNLYQWGPIGM